MLKRPARSAWLALLPVCALAGCGDTGTRRAPSSATTAPASRPAARPATTDGIDALTGAGTRPVVIAGTSDRTALLTDIRVARHEGYDRVVFEFARALPGYDVRYVRRPIRQDGSGRTTSIAGAFVVVIRATDALDADLTRPSAPPTYTGPSRLAPGTPEIVELARIGGFEGVLSWAVGLRDRVDFRVTTATSPPRLIVDFRNH